MKKLLVWFLMVALGVSTGSATLIYQSATSSPTGLGALTVWDNTYLGVRFSVSQSFDLTQVGGSFTMQSGDDGTFFAAIVRLDSFTDLPTPGIGTPFTASEIVTSRTISVTPAVFSDSILMFSLTGRLDPGIYGLVFGTGALGDLSNSGASRAIRMSRNNVDNGTPSYFNGSSSGAWADSATPAKQFIIEGNVVLPEPTVGMLCALAAPLLGFVRRRSHTSYSYRGSTRVASASAG